MKLLLSPHDDDSVLFAAFTCLRERPLVVVVTDSYVQPARGEVECSPSERASETDAAHLVLGCDVQRLGLRDDDLSFKQIVDALQQFNGEQVECAYVPALEGGHPQHDLVARAAAEVFGVDSLRCYSTYAKHSRYSRYGRVDLHPVGTTEVEWTREEYDLKMRAMYAYQSQLRVNKQHFDAVAGRSEWLSGYRRLNLGCGSQVKPGWSNIDRCAPCSPPPNDFIQADLAVTPWIIPDDSIDYVFSEDFLEHVPDAARIDLMNEIWRVLVPGGVMEHFVPNAGSRNDFGSMSHVSHWNLQCFEHLDVESYRWKGDRCFEGIECGFAKVSANLLNFEVEDDGVSRAQSIRVRYRAVKPC